MAGPRTACNVGQRIDDTDILLKATKNPYAKRLKQSVTIRLDESTVACFRALAEETALPYQTLINHHLRDCAATGRTLSMTWWGAKAGAA